MAADRDARRLSAAAPAAALVALAACAWLLRETPFRGEHWPFLERALSSHDAGEFVRRVAGFACFGARRFQPLAFFVPAAAYGAFGPAFLAHAALSLALQAAAALSFARLLRAVEAPPPSREPAWRLYPFETALFLVLFPGFDVQTWSFFQYVQVATALGALSAAWFLEGAPLRAAGAAAVAALVYEPFCVLPAVYAVFARLSGRRRPALFWAGLALLLAAPGVWAAARGAFPQAQGGQWTTALLGPVLLALNFASSLLVPVSADRTNIYELRSLLEAPPPLAFLGACAGSLALFLPLRAKGAAARREGRRACALAAAAAALLVCAARSGEGAYAALQFRYAYLLAPFVLAYALSGWKELSAKRPLVYASALAALIAVNAAADVRHALRVREDLAPLARVVGVLKDSSVPDRYLPERVLAALDARALGETDAEFLYNASNCLK